MIQYNGAGIVVAPQNLNTIAVAYVDGGLEKKRKKKTGKSAGCELARKT